MSQILIYIFFFSLLFRIPSRDSLTYNIELISDICPSNVVNLRENYFICEWISSFFIFHFPLSFPSTTPWKKKTNKPNKTKTKTKIIQLAEWKWFKLPFYFNHEHWDHCASLVSNRKRKIFDEKLVCINCKIGPLFALFWTFFCFLCNI